MEMSVVGNQVFNPPTMKSFGGIYASETYANFESSNFASPKMFNAPLTFHSYKKEGAEWLYRKAGVGFKYTDEATELFVRGMDANEMRVLAREAGAKISGGGPLADASQEQLVTAVRNTFKNSGDTKLNATISKLLTNGTEESIQTAQKLLKNLEDAGVADVVLSPSTLRQFSEYGGTVAGRELAQQGAGEVGEEIVQGSGGRTLDEVLEGTDGVRLTDNQFNALVRGTDDNPGFLRQIRNRAADNPTRWGVGSLLAISAIPTVGPFIVGNLLGRIFDGAGETLCIATGANCGGDDSDDNGSGLNVPECPSDMLGTECDGSATLQLGCVCSAGEVVQQGFKMNYKGYLAIGGMALGAVLLLTMVLR